MAARNALGLPAGANNSIIKSAPFLRHIICYAENTAIKKPAATADPITPATFGPIACINK